MKVCEKDCARRNVNDEIGEPYGMGMGGYYLGVPGLSVVWQCGPSAPCAVKEGLQLENSGGERVLISVGRGRERERESLRESSRERGEGRSGLPRDGSCLFLRALTCPETAHRQRRRRRRQISTLEKWKSGEGEDKAKGRVRLHKVRDQSKSLKRVEGREPR
jgi:hypothetical protein